MLSPEPDERPPPPDPIGRRFLRWVRQHPQEVVTTTALVVELEWLLNEGAAPMPLWIRAALIGSRVIVTVVGTRRGQ
jgi:hypothetical protein